jgi:hypothetical protein
MSQLLIDNLQEAVREGDAVLFVGAGVTIASVEPSKRPLASWPGLLKDAVQRVVDLGISLPPGWKQRQLEAIQSGDLDEMISAGEHITVKLRRAGEFGRWLDETAGQFRIGDPAVLTAIKDLELQIVTTNYDGLLEEATFLPAVTWRDPARVEKALRGAERAVVHVHGFFREPDSVILGVRSYVAITQDEHAQTMLRSLRTLKTLVFVGFGAGLQDPNFGAFLEWSGHVFGDSHYRHFRLALASEVASIQREHPGEQRVRVVPYGSEYSSLALFLRSLKGP